MNFRTLFVGVTALMLAILPSLAQDSAAPAETSGFIAITGTKATLANDVLTIEGVPASLPTLFAGFDPDFYPTNEMAAAWLAALQIANGEKTAAVDDVALEATVASARLMGKQGIGNDFIDYSATLSLTGATFDTETGTLMLNVGEVTNLIALNKDLAAIKSPRLPDEMQGFVLYIDLTPEFLDALANGAIQADVNAEGQGRPSGAKPCRPAAARRC